MFSYHFTAGNEQIMVWCKHQEHYLWRYTILGPLKHFLKIWCVTEGTFRHGGDMTLSLEEIPSGSYSWFCPITKLNLPMGCNIMGGTNFPNYRCCSFLHDCIGVTEGTKFGTACMSLHIFTVQSKTFYTMEKRIIG